PRRPRARAPRLGADRALDRGQHAGLLRGRAGRDAGDPVPREPAQPGGPARDAPRRPLAEQPAGPRQPPDVPRALRRRRLSERLSAAIPRSLRDADPAAPRSGCLAADVLRELGSAGIRLGPRVQYRPGEPDGSPLAPRARNALRGSAL